MSRDRRKGFWAGFKKAGPTTRFTIIVGVIALLSALYFGSVQLWEGATKGDLREAQGDRDEKHQVQLERIDEVKEIVGSRQITPVDSDYPPKHTRIYQSDEVNEARRSTQKQKTLSNNTPNLSTKTELFTLEIVSGVHEVGTRIYVDGESAPKLTLSGNITLLQLSRGNHVLRAIHPTVGREYTVQITIPEQKRLRLSIDQFSSMNQRENP